MKKTVIVILMTALALTFLSCAGGKGGDAELKKGIYTLNGAGTDQTAPYVYFDPENSTWHTGQGLAFSYALTGTYSQTEDRITAKGSEGNDMEIEFQIVSEKEIKVLSIKENVFLPDGKWISEGEHYMLLTEYSAELPPAELTPEELFEGVLPASDALAWARGTETVVIEQKGCTSGKEVWDRFCQTVTEGKPASVLCAFYYELDKEHVSEELYEEEKDLYPQMHFHLVEYDGTEFSVTIRESTAAEPDYHDRFKYLSHFTGDAPAGAMYSAYDRYVLVDDPSLTWEEIMAGMLSSRAGDMRRSCTVYQDYMGWKGD